VEDIHEILSNINGKIKPVKVPFFYKSAIIIVFIFMILLPALYLALIVSIGYLVYYHAVYTPDILFRAGGGFLKLIIYLGPIIIGGILIFFMIKPLFMKRHFEDDSIEVTRGEEPFLFDFIEKICFLVKAPAPKKVMINSEVNASASFSPGFFSFISNNLTLTIGTPLVYGLNLQQLAGVLAHEFGHFAQGAGMRISLLIRQINLWFAFIVSGRADMDRMLSRSAQNTDGRIGIILQIARIFIWFTSNILFTLMQMGNVISGFLLRQMEFDADRYEINLSGTQAFIQTSENIQLLAFTSQFAFDDLRSAWHEQKLINNYPKYLLAYRDIHIDKFRSVLENFKKHEKTGWFDTHPSDNARIKNAKKMNAPGIFNSDISSDKLFKDFEKLAQKSSVRLFQNVIGTEIKADQLVEVDEIISMQKSMENDYRNYLDYSLGIVSVFHEMNFFKYMDKSVDEPSLISELHAIREYQIDNSRKVMNELAEFVKIEGQKILALQAEHFIESGLTINKKEFCLDETTVENAQRKYKNYLVDQYNLKSLNDYILKLLKKLGITLSFYERNNSETIDPRYLEIKSIYKVLLDSFTDLQNIRYNFGLLEPLLQNLYLNEENFDLRQRVKNIIENSNKILNHLKEKYEPLFYPYGDDPGNKQLNVHFFYNPANKDNYLEFYNYLDMVIDKYFGLYTRMLYELTSFAVKVEKKLGIPPLSYKPETPDSSDKKFEAESGYIPFTEKYGPHISVAILLVIFSFFFFGPSWKSDHSGKYIPVEKLKSIELPVSKRLRPNTSYPNFRIDVQKSVVTTNTYGKYVILYLEDIINDELYLRIITTDAHTKAKSILTRLNKGEDFSKIASDQSLHPSRADNGYLGKFKLTDLNEAYRYAVKELQKGEFSEIITIVDVVK